VVERHVAHEQVEQRRAVCFFKLLGRDAAKLLVQELLDGRRGDETIIWQRLAHEGADHRIVPLDKLDAALRDL
jgi:hypothetical protein